MFANSFDVITFEILIAQRLYYSSLRKLEFAQIILRRDAAFTNRSRYMHPTFLHFSSAILQAKNPFQTR